MRKRGEFSTGGVIAIILLVVIGIAVTLDITIQYTRTNQDVVQDTMEQFTTGGYNKSKNLLNKNLVVGQTTVMNGTCESVCTSSPNSTLRDNIEYNVNTEKGVVTIINRSGTFNITYDYYPAGYVSNQNVRVIYSTLGILIAIGLLIALGKKLMMGDE